MSIHKERTLENLISLSASHLQCQGHSVAALRTKPTVVHGIVCLNMMLYTVTGTLAFCAYPGSLSG